LNLYEKLESVFIILAIIVGLGLGNILIINQWSGRFISPLLIAMIFGVFLKTPLSDLGKSFKNLKFALTSLGINFLWIPLLGYILGEIFLSNSVALKIGFIMLLITPCTDWYIIFTSLAKGNVSLSTAILPMNLIVQLLLMPVYLYIFTGLSGGVESDLILRSIFWTLVVPFGLSLIVKTFYDPLKITRKALSFIFADHIFLFLWLAIVCMFSSEAQQLLGNPAQFYILLPPVILFFFINFFVGRLAGKLAKLTYEDSVSLSMTTLARNSPVSLAVAVVAFPDQPFIALALVIGPLIEIPILAIIAQILLKLRPKSLNTTV
jgi:ACR3 family arsenite efflux pump ArsB